LNRWWSFFSQLLNVHRISDVRQIEIHTAEPLVPDPRPFKVEIVIARVVKLTVVIIVGYHCYQLHTKLYPIFFSQNT
jgi:hypothetical protein